MHIISAAEFPLFCSNYARKRLIMPAECSPQKLLIMLEIMLAEFIQAYRGLGVCGKHGVPGTVKNTGTLFLLVTGGEN